MSKQIVKIHYQDRETGPAEVLKGRVARIVDSPVLNLDLCRNSIVLLDRKPSDLRQPGFRWLQDDDTGRCHELDALLHSQRHAG